MSLPNGGRCSYCNHAEASYPLNVCGLKELAEEWAKDDRLWATRETVAFNLTTFGRKVLALVELHTHGM